MEPGQSRLQSCECQIRRPIKVPAVAGNFMPCKGPESRLPPIGRTDNLDPEIGVVARRGQIQANMMSHCASDHPTIKRLGPKWRLPTV